MAGNDLVIPRKNRFSPITPKRKALKMAFKKRRMMLIPDVNPKSFVFFFERGNSGTSWSIRDYSIRNRVKELGPHDFHWTADEVHERAVHSIDAPTVSTDNLAYWHEFTRKCNEQYLQNSDQEKTANRQSTPPSTVSSQVFQPRVDTPSGPVASISASLPQVKPQQASGSFAVVNLPELVMSSKGRKTQDMERILHSPNSEDWVTWNFFQIMFRQYPSGWWGQLVSAARRRNSDLRFPFDDRSLPRPILWSSIAAPCEYEAHSRVRMQNSGNRDWILRASNPERVEGPSEIDVTFDHERFLVYAEAKLGSDISMDTKYDPQRNQIARNIDCLIENAGNRMPVFWMIVRDEAPDRAYVQLMKSYKADPSLLARELPHREPATLSVVAENLTVLLWSDFEELVCGPGWDSESAAVKEELERRIVKSVAATTL
jgi:hypothetical protein